MPSLFIQSSQLSQEFASEIFSEIDKDVEKIISVQILLLILLLFAGLMFITDLNTEFTFVEYFNGQPSNTDKSLLTMLSVTSNSNLSG